MAAVGIRKALPPFGKEFTAKRRKGIVPINGVWITTHFDRARAFSGWRVVVPDNLDPLTLDFLFVAGLDVLCTADTFDRLEHLAQAVIHYRPKRLVGVSRDPPRLHLFKSA